MPIAYQQERKEYRHLFLFKQKTADEMRISDWSSDVCSSDLRRLLLLDSDGEPARIVRAARQMGVRPDVRRHEYRLPADAPRGSPGHAAARLYLSAGAGVRAAEPRLDDRGFHAWLGGVAVSDRPCAHLPSRPGGRPWARKGV